MSSIPRGMLAVVLFGLLSEEGKCQTLTSGNIVVERLGTGAAALSSSGTPVFIDQFTPTGGVVGSVTLPITSSGRPTSSPFNLVEIGNASNSGLLTRSANGLFINIPGYNGLNGETNLATSSSATVSRTVGVLSGSGVVDTSRSYNMLSGSTFRSVTSIDGTAFWAAGGNGIVFTGTGTSISTTNARNIGIANNTLFYSTGAGTAGIYQLGTAGTLPTSGSPVEQLIIGSTNPNAFQFNTAMSVAYIANSSTGVEKWTRSGTTWNLAYTYSDFKGSGLSVDWSDPSRPVFYALSATSFNNTLSRIVDNGSVASSAVTTVATAGTNKVFRGVEIALLPSVWTSSTGGDWASTTTTTYNATIGAVATPYDNWSTNLVEGTNIAFQKVNAASLTLNNNTSLTSVASIGFSGQGFGSSDTAYTLTGNALRLNGTNSNGSGVTGRGITNNSTVVQTINIPLTIAAANQSFTANNGGLVIGAPALNLGSGANGYTLTITGAKNTTISSVIQDGGSVAGSITKDGVGTLLLSGASTYTGTTSIFNGTIQLTSGNDRLPTSTVLSLGQTSLSTLGRLDLNGFDQQVAGLSSVTGTNITASNNTITSATPAMLTVGSGSGTFSFGGGTNANSGVITGAISLEKSGLSTQILGDSNTYTGTTTINGGRLQFAKRASLYNGDAVASWNATNIIVNNGGILGLNVGGTNEFNAADVDILKSLGNGLGGGFQSGSILGIDTTNAIGGNFTPISAITDTNGGSNSIGLTKLGSGRLILNGTNTYTGPTLVGGGTFAHSPLGSINNTPSITVAAGALYDFTAVSGYTLGFSTPQVLTGTGTVFGSVTVAPNSAIRAGTLSNGTPSTLSFGDDATTGSINLGGGMAGAILRVEVAHNSTTTQPGNTNADSGVIRIANGSGFLDLNPGVGNKFIIDVVSSVSHLLQMGTQYSITLASVATGDIRLNGLPAGNHIDSSHYTLQSTNFGFTDDSLDVVGSTELVLTFTPVPVPEPATVLGIAVATLAIGGLVCRRLLKPNVPITIA